MKPKSRYDKIFTFDLLIAAPQDANNGLLVSYWTNRQMHPKRFRGLTRISLFSKTHGLVQTVVPQLHFGGTGKTADFAIQSDLTNALASPT